jgi:hypothetical protein
LLSWGIGAGVIIWDVQYSVQEEREVEVEVAGEGEGEVIAGGEGKLLRGGEGGAACELRTDSDGVVDAVVVR